MARYTTNAKQVLRDGKHFADTIDDGAARLVADALNERRGMTQTCDRCGAVYSGQNQCPLCVGITSGLAPVRIEPPTQTQQTLPLDGADGPLFTGSVRVDPAFAERLQATLQAAATEADERLLRAAANLSVEMPFVCRLPSIRRENDEYACSCGARWDVADGEDHP
jgi:hypothetical protein